MTQREKEKKKAEMALMAPLSGSAPPPSMTKQRREVDNSILQIADEVLGYIDKRKEFWSAQSNEQDGGGGGGGGGAGSQTPPHHQAKAGIRKKRISPMVRSNGGGLSRRKQTVMAI